MLELTTQIANFYGIENILKTIKVDLHKDDEFTLHSINKKQCYDNAFNITTSPESHYDYCLCFTSVCGLPIEHAILFDTKNNKYIDPTLQKHMPNHVANNDYVLVKRFNINELYDTALKHGYAPTMHMLSNRFH